MRDRLHHVAPIAVLALLSLGAPADEAPDWQAQVPAATLRNDFASLYEGLQRAHADLYAHRSQAEYDARYAEIRAGLTEPMSLFDTQIAFQRFVAYGNVAHARIDFPTTVFEAFRERGGRTFPVYLRIVDGRAFVGEDYSGHDDVDVGDEILALNGEPMPTWLSRAAAHVSADTPYIAHSLLEYTFARYLWLESGEVASFDLLLSADGRQKRVTVAARTRDEQRAASEQERSGFVLDGDIRSYRMLDDAIAYLRPGPFYNVENPVDTWDNSAFITFVDAAFERFLEADARALIIDLRQNPGGDNSFSDHLVAWIADEPFRFCSAFRIRSSDEAAAANQARLDRSPGATNSASQRFAQRYAEVPRGEVFEFDIPLAQPRDGRRFQGAVYALVDRHSYSNTVNVAAILQDYGFGTIAGEKTADMATTYGAMETFTLPATGIEVGFPKAHIIRPSGDERSDGVTPDWPIHVPITPSQEDTVLDALVRRIRTQS